MKEDFPNFWKLSRKERVTFLLTFILLPLTAIGVRLFGYRSTWQILARLTRLRSTDQGGSSAERFSLAEAMTRLVAAAADRSIFHPPCLSRSLVLCWLLRREGIHSDLRFGVRLKDHVVEAHSWVEVAGRVLDPSGESSSCFPAFDAPIPLDEPHRR